MNTQAADVVSRKLPPRDGATVTDPDGTPVTLRERSHGTYARLEPLADPEP